MFKSSIQIVSYCLVITSDNLCKKSFLWLVIFSCCLAILNLHFLLLLLPFFFLENLRCSHFSVLREFRKYLGLSIFPPSLVTIKDLIPKSNPTVFEGAFFSGSITSFSITKLTKYL